MQHLLVNVAIFNGENSKDSEQLAARTFCAASLVGLGGSVAGVGAISSYAKRMRGICLRGGAGGSALIVCTEA